MKNLFAPLLFNSLILVAVLSLVGLSHVFGAVTSKHAPNTSHVSQPMGELAIEKVIANIEEKRIVKDTVDATIPDIF